MSAPNTTRSVSLPWFLLVVAVGIAVLHQGPLLGYALSQLDAGTLFGIQTLVTVFGMLVLLALIALAAAATLHPRLVKPVCVLFVLGNAVALYFVQTYGVLLDRALMGNVFRTDAREAAELLHWKLALHVAVYGLLPSLVILKLRVRPLAWWRRLLLLVGLMALGLGFAYANGRTWLWFDRHARSIGGLAMPWSYTVNSIRHLSAQWLSQRKQTALPALTFRQDERVTVVLVIGESARRANFSLYGYARATNPRLAALGAVALPGMSTCSTYTTESVACMLSHQGSHRSMRETFEPLPSYLQRHGVEVIWRTDNWGEPKLAVAEYARAADLRRTCGSACDGLFGDSMLLHGLRERLAASKAPRQFVVLHQHGSHGPAYQANVPPSFEVFKPVCTTVELNHCGPQDLVNAYDNTILYTDHVLFEVIAMLRSLTDRATVMLYVSDHGESLGEFGIYLHGAPLAIAPAVQREVPFILWMSDDFKRLRHVDLARVTAAQQHSLDEVFHSVLGAFAARSDVYRPEYDNFNPRR